MKRIIVILTMIILITPAVVHAGDSSGWEFRFFGINPADFEGRKVLPVIIGGITSFAVHEAGHYLAGKSVGMDPSFDWDKKAVWADDYDDKSDDQKAFFSAGGFIAQALVGTILTIIPKTRYSDFNVGFTAISSLEGIVYGITGGTQGDDLSDVKNLEKYGYPGTATAIGFGLYSGGLTYYNINKVKED
jgi:hypothetical protein